MNKKVTFTMDEIRRLEVIQSVESKQLTGKQSAVQRLDEMVQQIILLIAQLPW